VNAATRPNFLGAAVSSDFTRHLLVFGVSFKLGGGKKPAAADLGAGSPEALAAVSAQGKKQ
jgi:hypothetical protein